MVEVSLTVGKLDASLALLLTKDHHLIEFPTILLPDGVNAGSVITIKCEQDLKREQIERQRFESFQEDILEMYGTNEPKAPVLKVKNITQTSAVLEWDQLDLGSASIKSLTLYKNGSRLGQIPNPLVTKTTKLSGLPIDTPYEFYLRLDTTAGVYLSEIVHIRTHKMTDLSGITVCLGEIEEKENISREDIIGSLEAVGAKPLQDKVTVDTTHFVATLGLGPQWQKALDSNIPVVRPEWLKACEIERRIVPAREFYLDVDRKDLAKYKYRTPLPSPVHKDEEEDATEVGATASTVNDPAATDGQSDVPIEESASESVPAAEQEQEQEQEQETKELPESKPETASIQEATVQEEPTIEVKSEEPLEEQPTVEQVQTESEPIVEEISPTEQESPQEEAKEEQKEGDSTAPIEKDDETPVPEIKDDETTVETPPTEGFDDVDISAEEPKAKAEVEAEADAEVEAEADAEVEAEADAEVEAEADAEVEAEADAEVAEGEAEVAEGEAEVEAEADAEVEEDKEESPEDDANIDTPATTESKPKNKKKNNRKKNKKK